MLSALLAGALVLLQPTDALCRVRMHRNGNCPNAGDDVIRDFVSDGESQMYNWRSNVRINKWGMTGYQRVSWSSMALAEKLEDWTSAISFEGNCKEIEIFDQGAGKGYGDNCRVTNGEIVTTTACYWSCNSRNNCGGSHVKNCVSFREDLHDDVGGIYLWGPKTNTVGREIETLTIQTDISRLAIMGVSVGLMAMTAAVVMCYKRGKNESEEVIMI